MIEQECEEVDFDCETVEKDFQFTLKKVTLRDVDGLTLDKYVGRGLEYMQTCAIASCGGGGTGTDDPESCGSACDTGGTTCC